MKATYLFSSHDRFGYHRLYSVSAESSYLALVDLITLVDNPANEMDDSAIWTWRSCDTFVPVAQCGTWQELSRAFG